MSFPKLPLLVGLVSVSSLSAQAQTGRIGAVPAPGFNPPNTSYTTVDANGNMVRAPRPDANALGAPATAGQTASSDRSRRDRNGNRNDTVHYGSSYYVPGNGYYLGGNPGYPGYPGGYPGYPGYPAPSYNNYYYPAQPTTTIIAPPALSWARPSTITTIPLGGAYGGYGAPAYPGYPYPSYPAPGYGYPAAGYGYPAPGYGYPAPAYGYPVYPGYPAYGSTTTIYSNVPGGIYSQSQTSGYGFSVGGGGLSIQLGNRKSTSSTTTTRY